jgi:hypothetical protein
MPYRKVTFPPGINREGTQYSAEGNWYDCDLIRFRQGRPEKIGGWTKYSQNEFLGISRTLLNWSSILSANLMAIGTDKKLYVDLGGVYHDITPMEYKSQGTLDLDMANTSTNTNAQLSFDVLAGDVVRMSSDANSVGDELMIVATGGLAGATVVLERGSFSTITSAHTSGDAAFLLEKLSNPIYPIAGSSTVLINFANHGLTTGDFINFLSMSSSPTGLDRRSLFYPLFDGATNPASGYDAARSTQSWCVKRVLNADYFEIVLENSASGTPATLEANLSNSDTTVQLSLNSFVNGDYIKIGDEYIKITSGSSGAGPYTYNCNKGQFGSRSLNHSSGLTASLVGASGGSGSGGDTIIMRDIQASESTFVEFSGWGAGTWGGIPSATTSTTLTANLAAGATASASVASTTSFPSLGSIIIDSEVISYASTGGSSFNTLTRGDYGSVDSFHSSGSSVFLLDQYWTGWGDPTVPISNSETALNAWSLDTFGEDLVGCKTRTKPFYWNTSLKMSNGYPNSTQYLTSSYTASPNGYASGIMLADAVPMSSLGLSTDDGHGSVPDQVGFLMTNPASRQIIAFGATDTFGNYDPMLIRWCDNDRPGSWEATSSNSAGGAPLQKGSKIISAARSDRQILVWTDSSIYSMAWIGGNDVFAIQEVADGISLASRHAHKAARGIVYWMGDNNFFRTDGSTVEKIECSVLSKVFEELNYSKREVIFSASNLLFNEIIWFYPSGSSEEPNNYVLYNYIDGTWAYGSMPRTSWSDSGLREKPNSSYNRGQYSSGAYQGIERSIIYNQEDGYKDDQSKMNSYIESAYFDIDEGDESMFVDRFIPDIRGLYATTPKIAVDLVAKDYPASTRTSTRSLTLDQSIEYVNTRIRGKTMSVKFYDNNSTQEEAGWELGDSRMRVKPDGRR